MKLFKRKKEDDQSKVDKDIQSAVDTVKDLDKAELNRLIEGYQFLWEGCNRLRKVRTRDEKETKPVDDVTNSFIETPEEK